MTAALRVHQLSKQFGALKALSDVSIEVEPGERRAVIGPNGAGKTTFFHVLSGMLPPSHGTIELFGRDVTRLPTHARAAHGLARTFQITNLFPRLSVEHNVVLALLGLRRTKFALFRPLPAFGDLRRDALRLLDEWALADRAQALVSELAYGDQRVLEILLAVAQRPRLLLLDEPTAGLSPAETAYASDIIRNLPREMAMLLIEHDLDVVFDLCDSMTVLHLGQVLAQGSPAAMRADARVQEIYLGIG